MGFAFGCSNPILLNLVLPQAAGDYSDFTDTTSWLEELERSRKPELIDSAESNAWGGCRNGELWCSWNDSADIRSILERMTHKRSILLSLLAATVSVAVSSGAAAGGSKRIEVYTLAQSYYDTQHGDTLGEIVAELLPNNPGKHDSLRQEILGLNPDAFIDNNPDRLIAGKRLRLPGYVKEADTRVDPHAYTVESFSWGNIKRPR